MDISSTREHYVFEIIISSLMIIPKALIVTIKIEIEIEAIRSIPSKRKSHKWGSVNETFSLVPIFLLEGKSSYYNSYSEYGFNFSNVIEYINII